MTRIIFHLGPGKCGSSAIQSHLRRVAAARDAPLQAAVLTGPDIRALEDGAADVMQKYTNLMAQAAAQDRPLIISHEALFKKHGALIGLVQAACGQGADISALAYVRRQSDFLRSVHAQWLFREPARIAETADLLRGHGVDPALFTGAERHLMAISLGHLEAGRQGGGQAYFDWSQSMPDMAALLAPQGATLQVAALPSRDAKRPLIDDFMARIGVIAPLGGAQGAVVNAAFDPAMVEAVSNAIECGYAMPGRHEANRFLAAGDETLRAIDLPDGAFLAYLSDCIDTQFEARNQHLAETFGIDPTYFKPRRQCDTDALRDVIRDEAARRAKQPASERAARITARAEAVNTAWRRYQSDKVS
jgi:hypothetical protein